MSDSALTPQESSISSPDLANRVASELGVDRYRAEQVIQTIRAEYSGPTPPTSEIIALNAIQPGLGTRLVEDHLLQREHERHCDLEDVKLAHKDPFGKISGLPMRIAAKSMVCSRCLRCGSAILPWQ
jgi:hypothetical protein